jgi:hypothetical protein
MSGEAATLPQEWSQLEPEQKQGTLFCLPLGPYALTILTFQVPPRLVPWPEL